LEALNFEVAICRNDEPDPEFDDRPRLTLNDIVAAHKAAKGLSAEPRESARGMSAEPRGGRSDSMFARRRQRFEQSMDALTNAARQTIRSIGSAHGWKLDDSCPYLIVQPDHEGGAILTIFDEVGRKEWLIDPSGSERLFSQTPPPSTNFFVW
jgi:hypothetical protein